MLRWHRLCAILSVVLLAYVVATGTGIELADMRALVSHAPATDPDMLMMRQHIYGPPNYAVLSAADFPAASLPAGLDEAAALAHAAALGRAAAPGADLRLVELRMAAGILAGHVQMGRSQLIFDLANGTPLPSRDLPPPEPGRGVQSPRAWFKGIHRFNYIGQPATALDLLAGLAFTVMIVTGFVHYARVLQARARIGRSQPFWRGGGLWRDLHRWLSVLAGIVVVWLTLSGIALSIDNVGAYLHGVGNPHPVGPANFDGDLSSPIADAELAPMAQATLAAFHRAQPGMAIKVIRLRKFVRYSQGVVVTAAAPPEQLVFNTQTGAAMAMWEPGYPDLGFPAGWDWHQRLKRMHRGDIFGMPGRWLDTLGALSLVYLTVSGVVMYAQLWLRRRRNGQPALSW